MEILSSVIQLITAIILLFVAIRPIFKNKLTLEKIMAKREHIILALQGFCLTVNFFIIIFMLFTPYALVGVIIGSLFFIAYVILFFLSTQTLSRADIGTLILYSVTMSMNMSFFHFLTLPSIIDKIVSQLESIVKLL